MLNRPLSWLTLSYTNRQLGHCERRPMRGEKKTYCRLSRLVVTPSVKSALASRIRLPGSETLVGPAGVSFARLQSGTAKADHRLMLFTRLFVGSFPFEPCPRGHFLLNLGHPIAARARHRYRHRTCLLGAGIGNVARLFRAIHGAARYSICDLPETLIFARFYLSIERPGASFELCVGANDVR
jgi:hypothetical protein